MKNAVGDYEKSTPFNYPGQRHEGNFLLLDGDAILDVSRHPAVAMQEIDNLLKERFGKEAVLIEDRIPVLAFGRNASPEGAASKTEKYVNGLISTDDLGTFPMMKATLAGHDVVWHGRPGQKGGYFAELLDTPDSPDATVGVWVQFLTTEQLATIHTTEGATYEVSEVPHVSLGDGIEISAAGYTARDASLLLDAKGNPVSVKGIERSGHDSSEMDVHQALEYTLGQQAVIAALGEQLTPEAFIEQGETLTVSERKLRQAMVHDALRRTGLSREFHYGPDGYRYSRADFGTLPRGVKSTGYPTEIHLMEEDLAAIRPNPDVVAAKMQALREKYPDESDKEIQRRALTSLDPAQNIRTRARTELLDPEREVRLAQWKQEFDKHHGNPADTAL